MAEETIFVVGDSVVLIQELAVGALYEERVGYGCLKVHETSPVPDRLRDPVGHSQYLSLRYGDGRVVMASDDFGAEPLRLSGRLFRKVG